MNMRQLKKVVPVLMKHNIVPFIWGQQGIGKTQGVKQISESMGGGFVHLLLGTACDVGDLIGLLVHNQDGTVKHARPEWFPTEGKGIIFLDELNRAHPDILQAMFSFILSGTLHTHTLPPGWKIVAAGNYQSNKFQLTDTSDAAWMSRFCHIDFQPTKEEFVQYLEDENMESVADFLRKQPEMIELEHKERLNYQLIEPDRRNWHQKIGKLENEAIDDERFEVYAGIVGQTAAAALITHKRTQEKKISFKMVLNAYESVRDRVLKASTTSETRFDLLNCIIEEAFAYLPDKTLTDEQMDNFKNFLLDIPLEMGLKFFKGLTPINWNQKIMLKNDKEFIDRYSDRKLKHG